MGDGAASPGEAGGPESGADGSGGGSGSPRLRAARPRLFQNGGPRRPPARAPSPLPAHGQGGRSPAGLARRQARGAAEPLPWGLPPPAPPRPSPGPALWSRKPRSSAARPSHGARGRAADGAEGNRPRVLGNVAEAAPARAPWPTRGSVGAPCRLLGSGARASARRLRRGLASALPPVGPCSTPLDPGDGAAPAPTCTHGTGPPPGHGHWPRGHGVNAARRRAPHRARPGPSA